MVLNESILTVSISFFDFVHHGKPPFIGLGCISRNSFPQEMIAMYSHHYTVWVSEGFFIQQVLKISSISKNIIQAPSFGFGCPHLPPKLLNQLKSASLTHWNTSQALPRSPSDLIPSHGGPPTGTVEDLL